MTEPNTPIPIGAEVVVTWAENTEQNGAVVRHLGNYLFPHRKKWSPLPRIGSQWLVKVTAQPTAGRNIYLVAPIRQLDGPASRGQGAKASAAGHPTSGKSPNSTSSTEQRGKAILAKATPPSLTVSSSDDTGSLTVTFEQGDVRAVAHLPDGSIGIVFRHSWIGKQPQPGERRRVWPILHLADRNITFLSSHPPRKPLN